MTASERYGYVPPQEQSLLEGRAKLFTTEVRDTKGTPHTVDYVRLTETPGTAPVTMLDVPWVQDHLSDILSVTRERFPTYTGQYVADRYIQYINNANGLDIVTAPDGHVAGFHFYKMRSLDIDGAPIKTLYTHYAAIREQDEGKNLTELARVPALDIEDPDIIVGSTGNPAIYIANARLAQSRGMVFYPTSEDVPDAIVELGQQIVDVTKAEPEPRPVEAGLMRTYLNPVARGKGPSFELFDETLHLGPNQQVLYMMIKPQIDARVKGTSAL